VSEGRAIIAPGAERLPDGPNELRRGWAAEGRALIPRTTDKDVLDAYPACSPTATSLCDEVPDDTADARSGRVYPEAMGLQTSNPGFPGFTSGGFIALAGLTISWMGGR